MISKICLGTVQFGLDYGIANKRGMVLRSEVFDILRYSKEIGLKALDTSMAYGESEQVIGEFIKEEGSTFDIVSKIALSSEAFDPNDIKVKFREALQRAKAKKFYGYLIHHFDDFLKYSQLWTVLEGLKKEGLIAKIGFSLYRPEDLDILWERNIQFDIVQVPFSVLDGRFEKYFKLLKERNVEVHTRSAFLQGLVFLSPDQLSGQLALATRSIQRLRKISEENGLSISALCLNYVLSIPFIDKAVIGVDSLEQLKNNVSDLEHFKKIADLHDELKSLALSDEDILLPMNWKLQEVS